MIHLSDLIDDNKPCHLISFDGKRSLLCVHGPVFRSFKSYYSGYQKQNVIPCGILLLVSETILVEMPSCHENTHDTFGNSDSDIMSIISTNLETILLATVEIGDTLLILLNSYPVTLESLDRDET
jgi:hypothetical protein